MRKKTNKKKTKSSRPTKSSSVSPERATAELWRRAELRYKLRAPQLPLYDHVKAQKSRHAVAAMHRGAGKSFAALLWLVEGALGGNNTKYVGPTAKMVRSIAFPNMQSILHDCPEHYKPRFRYSDGFYEFPSGGSIWLAGADGGHADSLRGTDTHRAVLDEEGFMDDPDYVVNDVLLPRALTVGGQILHVSTPPKSPSHPFARRMSEARENGTLFVLRASDNPTVSREQLDSYARACGGFTTTAFRREFLCEVLTEEKDAVVNEQIVACDVTNGAGTPTTAARMDPSGLSVALFGRVLPDGRVVVLSELCRAYQPTGAFLMDVRESEAAVFGADRPRRVSVLKDPERRLVAQNHGMVFGRLPQDELKPLVGHLRTMVRRGRLSVDSSCSVARRHASDAVWNDGRTGFGGSGDGGHFDALHPLMWLARLGSAEPRSQEPVDFFAVNPGRLGFVLRSVLP